MILSMSVPGFVCLLLQIAEADDVAVCLDGVQNTVGAGKCLNKPVLLQILVHPQGIEGRGVKTGQEHIDNDQKIHFTPFHAQREILVVVLELLRGRIKIHIEIGIVLSNRCFQKIAGGFIETVGIKVLIRENIPGIGFICAVAENGGDIELASAFGKLFFQLSIIFHRHRDRTDCQNGVEARHALPLQGIKAIALVF